LFFLFSLSLSPQHVSYENTCHWIVKDNLDNPEWYLGDLNILNLIISTKSLFPSKVTFTDSRDLTWTHISGTNIQLT
jgi:hypothetical protein